MTKTGGKGAVAHLCAGSSRALTAAACRRPTSASWRPCRRLPDTMHCCQRRHTGPGRRGAVLTCAASLRALTFFFHVIVLLLVEVADALCTAAVRARILPLGPIRSGRWARTIVLNEIVGLLAVARGAGFELALVHLLVHIRLVMDLCGAGGQSAECRAAGAAQRCPNRAAPMAVQGRASCCSVRSPPPSRSARSSAAAASCCSVRRPRRREGRLAIAATRSPPARHRTRKTQKSVIADSLNQIAFFEHS